MSLLTSASVTEIKWFMRRGSLISLAKISLNSRMIAFLTRSDRLKSALLAMIEPSGLLCVYLQRGSFQGFDGVNLDDVTFLQIIETIKRETAFITRSHFFDVILEAF